MSIRLYGNQHGHFVKADGEHLFFIRLVASKEGISEQEALKKILREYLECHKNEIETKEAPAGKDEGLRH